MLSTGEDVDQLEFAYIVGRIKMAQTFWKSLTVSYETINTLTQGPAIPLLDTYREKYKQMSVLRPAWKHL